ncbi:hypothetical protein C2857_007297 [Epichloe festucae Fl1]|uniref:GH16 domain-containing protein n=1 Tax=Epichloe festucae (strain Fl1) TaxID=877507 RepID=A0A7S9KM89_EPIFF|nr:hypothetical protein C2857_007297 [Epichloe festucae Fl1]
MFRSATVLLALLFASAGLGNAAKRLAQIDHVDQADIRGSASVSVSVSASVLPSGFSRCLFYDDFSQPSGHLPDPSKWQVDLGTAYPGGGPEHWGTGEIQTYTGDAANLRVTREGTLKITPVRDGRNKTWTSSRIETTADWDFACPRGHRMRVEARIRLGGNPGPVSMGIWPAFWVLGSGYRANYSAWPAVGEVDILESVNGEARVWQTVHCGTSPGGACNEPSGRGHVSDGAERASWHTFAWEVDRRRWPLGLGSESMAWLVDGETRWTFREADLHGDEAWHAVVANSKMVLLNVAVGGALPNAIAGFDTPTNRTRGGDGAAMEVDYVAVYSSWL